MTLSFTQVKEWFPVAIAGTSVSAMNVFLFLGAAMGTSLSAFVMKGGYAQADFSTLWSIMLALSVFATLCIAVSREKGKSDEIVG